MVRLARSRSCPVWWRLSTSRLSGALRRISMLLAEPSIAQSGIVLQGAVSDGVARLAEVLTNIMAVVRGLR